MKVLIVEDELLIAVELDRIVDGAGHEIVGVVASVDQALAYAAKAEVALVDLRLADGPSGGSLARRLIDRFGIKVIFVTGNPNEVGYGLDGAIDVIAKPFTDDRIIAALSKAEEAVATNKPSAISR
jgi:DNA-binding LytR/AlgR family response regulator